MILKINGIECQGGSLPKGVTNMSYEEIHDYVEACQYDSVSERIMDLLQKTDWYQQSNSDFNIFKNWEGVKNLCKDDALCLMDAVNRSVMESTKGTEMIYKFISHRAALVRDGFENNFWQGIDWEMVLDCILWFM